MPPLTPLKASNNQPVTINLPGGMPDETKEGENTTKLTEAKGHWFAHNLYHKQMQLLNKDKKNAKRKKGKKRGSPEEIYQSDWDEFPKGKDGTPNIMDEIENLSEYIWFEKKGCYNRVMGFFKALGYSRTELDNDADELMTLLKMIEQFGQVFTPMHAKDLFSFIQTKYLWKQPVCRSLIYAVEHILANHKTLKPSSIVSCKAFVQRVVDFLQHAKVVSPEDDVRKDQKANVELEVEGVKFRIQNLCRTEMGIENMFRRNLAAFVGHFANQAEFYPGNFFGRMDQDPLKRFLEMVCVFFTTTRVYHALLMAALPHTIVCSGLAESVDKGKPFVALLKKHGIFLEEGHKHKSILGQNVRLNSTVPVSFVNYKHLIKDSDSNPPKDLMEVLNLWRNWLPEYGIHTMRALIPASTLALQKELVRVRRVRLWKNLITAKLIVIVGALLVAVFSAIGNYLARSVLPSEEL